jgi:phospholipid/cholesterol/gamma-HCH transport system substrate-binding protein
VKPVLNKALAVGALVAVAGLAFLFAFTFFKKGGYSESESYVVRARFSDATGLTWKSKVQIAGIQIGEVTKITLVGAKALLEIRVKKDVPLHTDACLYKTFPSALLPDALLDVVPGSDAKPLLSSLPEDQREITCVREAASVQQLLDAMAKIATDVQTVTGDLAATVKGDQGSLREIIENLARITRQVESVVDQNTAVVSDILANTRDFTGDLREISGRDKERIHSIIRNIDDLTAQLKTVAASTQTILGVEAGAPGVPGAPGPSGSAGPSGGAGPSGAASPQGGAGPTGLAAASGTNGAGGPLTSDQAQTREQAKGVQQAVGRLNDSLAKLDDMLGKVNEGKSVAGKLLVDERLGRKFGSAVEGVSDYVDRLQKLQIEMNLRSEWLLNQSIEDGRPGAKIYVGARLLPRPDKFYLFEVVSDPRGVDTITTETITTRQPGSTTETTTVVNRTLHEDRFTFSLQIGKRYGPLTFRAGLIESSGGVGTDVHLLDDALQLSVSMYQFNRVGQNVYPRAKVWANYALLQHFYLTTGVDDFLNRWQSLTSVGGRKFNIGTDVFFGVGLVFTDDDIKTLLLSGSGSVAGSASSSGGR